MQGLPGMACLVLVLSLLASPSTAVWGWISDVVVKPKSELTCWTCPSRPDNNACNAWAPDLPCPANTSVCRTEHRMDLKTGVTVGVVKSCAKTSDCDETHIGCHVTADGKEKVCLHCCDHAYCNEGVAVNYSHASLLSSLTSARSLACTPCPLPWVLAIVLVLVVLVAPLIVL